MPDMSLKKNEMPVQQPDVRNKNFSEVALGYTEEQAVSEAKRCLNCKNRPCSALQERLIGRILLKNAAFFNKIQLLNQALTCISTRFFSIIRVLFRYTDNCTELCRN